MGAGSTYTPELVDGLLRRGLPVTELVLHDVDQRRLSVLAGFVARMVAAAAQASMPGAAGGRPELQVTATTSLREAVTGARLVFSQFRVGGQAARHGDEELGRRWEIVGQETTGVGGFAKGLRTVPVALEVQRAVATYAAKDAWLVNFTNPAGMVTEALLAHGAGDPPRVVGLCNFPWVLQQRLAAGLGTEPAALTMDYVGLNHLAWVRDVHVDGRSRLPDALAVWRLGPDAPFFARLVDDLGIVLNPYLQYYYETERILGAQREAPTRAEVVAAVEADLLERYADPRTRWDPAMLSGRGGTSYSVAAAALAADLVGTPHERDDAERRHVVNVRNGGALPGLPDDAVVETTCVVGAEGADPVATAELERPARGLANQVKDFERYTIEAATTGDRRSARLALLTHPLCPDAAVVDQLLDDLLKVNRAWLPAFE